MKKETIYSSNIKRVDSITSIIYLREYVVKNNKLLVYEDFKNKVYKRIEKIKEIHSYCSLTNKIAEEFLEELEELDLA